MILYDLFESPIDTDDSKIAIIHYKNVDAYEKITRLQLQQEITKISNCLGRCVNQVIGVLIDSNILLAPIVLGISKCNNSFILLDFENQSRNEFLIKQLGITLLLSTENIKETHIIDELIIFNRPLKVLKRSTDLIEHEHDISYVICTSGTTGEPKSVKVTNQCILQNIESLRSKLCVTSQDVVLLNTPITFDPFIVELYLSVSCNATLVTLDPPQLIKHPRDALCQLFSKTDCFGVTILQIPPSIFLNFATECIQNIICHKNSSLRVLALGGESVPNVRFILHLMECNAHLNVFNFYGITEVSCWASVYKCRTDLRQDDMVLKYGFPLGEPLLGTNFGVFNAAFESVEDGEGELFIDCTDRMCYIPTEQPITLNNRSYRSTGDTVHKDCKSKNLYYLGRTNRVIKKFGHRISLDQIEMVVSNFISAPSACIWKNTSRNLTVFTTTNSNVTSLREHVLKTVSKAALIDEICIIDKLPLTRHGKINRDELQRLITADIQFTTTGELFQTIVCKYVQNFDLDKSFYAVGGTSIIAMELVNQFEQNTNGNFPVEIFNQLLNPKLRLKDIFDNFNHLTVSSNRIDQRSKKLKVTDGKVLKTDTAAQMFVEMQWKYDMEGCVDASPCICKYRNNILVIIGAHSGKLSIINFETGHLLFEIHLDNRIEGTASCLDQWIFVGCYSGHVYCIDLETESIKWKYKTESRVKAPPVLCKEATALVIGSYDQKFHCINIHAGNEEWSVPLCGSISSKAVLHDKHLHVATIQGHCYCVAENDGKIIWQQNVDAPIFGGPTLFANTIIYPDAKGGIHCFSADGTKIWTYQADAAVYSSLITNKNMVYFGCHDSCLYALEVGDGKCRLQAKYQFDSPIFATPCQLENPDLLVVNSMKGGLYVCDLRNEEQLAKIQLGGEIFSTPVIYQNNIVVGCRDDFVYVFKIIQK